jgi:hypothetical protein
MQSRVAVLETKVAEWVEILTDERKVA